MGDGVLPRKNAIAHIFDDRTAARGFAIVAGIVHGEAFAVGR